MTNTLYICLWEGNGFQTFSLLMKFLHFENSGEFDAANISQQKKYASPNKVAKNEKQGTYSILEGKN